MKKDLFKIYPSNTYIVTGDPKLALYYYRKSNFESQFKFVPTTYNELKDLQKNKLLFPYPIPVYLIDIEQIEELSQLLSIKPKNNVIMIFDRDAKVVNLLRHNSFNHVKLLRFPVLHTTKTGEIKGSYRYWQFITDYCGITIEYEIFKRLLDKTYRISEKVVDTSLLFTELEKISLLDNPSIYEIETLTIDRGESNIWQIVDNLLNGKDYKKLLNRYINNSVDPKKSITKLLGILYSYLYNITLVDTLAKKSGKDRQLIQIRNEDKYSILPKNDFFLSKIIDFVNANPITDTTIDALLDITEAEILAKEGSWRQEEIVTIFEKIAKCLNYQKQKL